MRLETHLTRQLGWFEHFNHSNTALSYLPRYIVSCVVLNVSSIFFALK